MRSGTGKPAPWLYLFGTLLWTWIFLGLASITGQFWLEFPTALLSLIGGLGPVIVALILIYGGYWDKSLDSSAIQYLLRCFNPKTLSWGWYLKILGLIVIIVFFPVIWEFRIIGDNSFWEIGPLSFILVGLVIGALEEIGWRGYGQEALQRQLPVVISGLIIGIFWAAWHLPLFFIEGTYQHVLGWGSPEFWSFHISILVSSPLYGWLYNAAGRVVLAPLLFHGLGNLGGELVPSVSPGTSIAVHAGLTLIVTVVSWQWMKRIQ